MRVIDNKTNWAKIGRITSQIFFIGKEVIFFGSGCHLLFLNVTTNQEYLYLANNKKNGDGIRCLSGHRLLNIFAFAENCTDPAIFIKSFPNFEDIVTLRDDNRVRGYTNLAFSNTSLLISIGDLPRFAMTIWNWRRGEKIATKDTNLLLADQYLRCSLGSPVFFAQLGIGTTKLYIWDIVICGKKSVLTKHIAKIPPDCNNLTNTLWTSEGTLFVCGEQGCVYAMRPDHFLEKVIDSTVSGPIPATFAWYKMGITVAGPNREIRHYKKSGTWTMDWSVDTSGIEFERILSRIEILAGISDQSEVFLISPEEIKCVKKGATSFVDFCMVLPTGQFIVTLNTSNTLNTFEIATGNMVCTYNLKTPGKALVMAGNPQFPYLAIGLDNGVLELVSAYNPHHLVKMTQFNLAKDRIDAIYFNECGLIFVAGNLQIGQFFIIEGLPGGEMEILSAVTAKQQIVSFMLVISRNCYRIFAIPVTSNEILAGNKFLRYCVIKHKSTNIKEYKLKEADDTLYSNVCPINGLKRDRVFFAVPYHGKMIHEIEIKRGNNMATVLRKIQTGHQMSHFDMKLDVRVALTWGEDGLIIGRDANFQECIALALPHHRMGGGVVKAYIDPYEKYVISIGTENILVCTDLVNKQMDPDQLEDLTDLLKSSTFKLLFSKKTTGFVPTGDMEGKCYLEVLTHLKIEKERKKCEKERHAILRELKSIREELVELLTENIEGPDNEKLDLQEFNLHKKWYDEKCQYQKKLQNATYVYLNELMSEQNRIAKFILENFYKTMRVPGTTIRGIFANFEVDNYVLLPESLSQQEFLKWIKHQKYLEKHFNDLRPFKPWVPLPEEEIIALLTEKPGFPKAADEIVDMTDIEDDEDVEEDKQTKCLDTKCSFSGSDVQKFLDIGDLHYLQNELITYYQNELQWVMSKHDSGQLKEYFNKYFDSAMSLKLKEMNTLKERNDRLRHIISEINYFSVDKFSITITDPEWDQRETPQQITEVKDFEVPITPYISPEEQRILDAKAAEAERIRLLLLADDFRERALMAMMNGVLEIRWEDELKKDVPIPKCMIEKEPEHFNEDDLRAVRDYEDKVKFLNSERERYKNLLTLEYAKVANFVRDSIRKFNGKLSDLLLLKLKVDSAISQETLKNERMKLFMHRRTVMVDSEKKILQTIEDNDKVVESVQKLVSSLHGVLIELRSHVENIQSKDKTLERAFRKDIQDMSIVVQEQAIKLYKKRPKTNIKALTSTTTLNELIQCILTPTYKPIGFPQDCYDFLRALDNQDQFVGISAVVDESSFHLVCKHRRIRIEHELRIRAALNEVTEAESTISSFVKRLAHKKELNVKLLADLENIRSEMIHACRDIQMQIVMPKGLVEIPLSGHLSDFNDATMICRKEIDDINRIILEFGEKKLKSLNLSMGFRRKILIKEWEHRKMKMQIEDLEEKLMDVSHVRLTKEIQYYLKSKNKDKSIPFETEVDMIKASYENTIQDRKDQVNRLKKQINTLREQDKVLDQKISEINVDVCEFTLLRDTEIDQKEKEIIDARMKTLMRRTNLVQEIQDSHHEILVLHTELELLRLKTFPTLKYRLL